MIRPIDVAYALAGGQDRGGIPPTGNTVLFPKAPNNSHTRLSPCAGIKKLQQTHCPL